MTMEQILSYVYPYTAKQRKCAIEKQKWQHKREKLTRMIEAYKRGDVVYFEDLKVSIDIEQMLKQFRGVN
jgi:hypothetical protein